MPRIKHNKNVILVSVAGLLLLLIVGPLSIANAAPNDNLPQPLNPLSVPKWENQLPANIPVFMPTETARDSAGNVIGEKYYVNVTQFNEDILPVSMGLPATTVWGYGGTTKDAWTGQPLGYYRSSPSPTFEVTRGVFTQVTWVNNLTDNNGNPLPYMYPVDPTFDWANSHVGNSMMSQMEAVQQAKEQANINLAPPFPPGYNGVPISNSNGATANPDGWNYQSPVPIVTHVHGAEVQSTSDGGPLSWYTPDGRHGPTYYTKEPTSSNAAVYYYPNKQQETTLWYHDHTMGVTRLSVFSGLAGFYLIRDPSSTIDPLLPNGSYEIPLAIQDRSFYTNGQFNFNPMGYGMDQDHPYWNNEYFGDVMVVNGKAWPNLNVNQSLYRFRILDGCNARFLTISFKDTTTNVLIPFTMIGTEGGFLKAPVTLQTLTVAPAERPDILVNFTGIPAGHKIIMQNTANAPYPVGVAADSSTIGQIMQFTVQGESGPTQHTLPAVLNSSLKDSFPSLPSTNITRTLTLTMAMNPIRTVYPEGMYIDGQPFDANITEMPVEGSTEEWQIVDATSGSHPIHLHLVMFQVVSRQPYNQDKYYADWLKLNNATEYSLPLDHPTANLESLLPYITGPPIAPRPEEQGWKDTVKVNPGEITTIRVRFAPQDGSTFPFNVTEGPGYVWHCHILDHEDNSMMRPFTVVAAQQINTPTPPSMQLILIAAAVIIIVIASIIVARKYIQKK